MSRPRLASGAEFDLIRRFYEGATQAGLPDVRVGPGDDCVVLADGIAISTDVAVENVHFRRTWLRAREIGFRSTAAACSDLAAVAARPIGALVSLLAPRPDVPDFAAAVMEGVLEAVQGLGGVLLGGDVALSPGGLALDVIAVGRTDAPVLRSGACPGDALWVTGRLGGAGAAVASWSRDEKPSAAAREAFARPRPRVEEALWLARRGVLHSLIDLSDGLAGDAEHIAAASGVRIVLDEAALPLHPDSDVRLALSGGEDYELCFSAAAGAVESIAREFEERFGLKLSRVGEVAAGAGVALRKPDGQVGPLDVAGFRHFEERQ